ncbi:MAG: LacI family transcriptional regulator [Treponema sp.]|jgi:DNA-binding LacI/PurR family transcriptional regulator|nr:LacI family transcriptional regulator [Treponema sp.]
MVTIHDVAKAAGVSIATVSRVLNNNNVVTESKRERVFQVMRELGYVPVSRTAKSAPGNQIILVVSSIFPMLEEVYSGIAASIRELDAHYEVALCYTANTKNNYHNALSLIKMLPPELLRGLIFFNNVCADEGLMTEFQRYPLVQIGEYVEQEPVFAVSTDDRRALYDITKLLIDRGRRRFVLVSNYFSPERRSYRFCTRREAGFRAALEEAGIPFNRDMIFSVDYTVEGGIDAARKIAELTPQPDAVVCVSDYIAAGCVMELRELGVSVPDQIAVTGFDDIEIAETCRPRLTTVRQSFEEMGMEAVRMLDALCAGSLNIGRTTCISHSIIERGSA